MEAALESDGFVVTGVSMSFEIGASIIQIQEHPRALMENDPTLSLRSPSTPEYKQNTITSDSLSLDPLEMIVMKP